MTARKGAVLKAWFEHQVLPAFEGRVLPVDNAVALRSAPLHVPDPHPVRNGLIAATALVHGMTVVTGRLHAHRCGRAESMENWNLTPIFPACLKGAEPCKAVISAQNQRCNPERVPQQRALDGEAGRPSKDPQISKKRIARIRIRPRLFHSFKTIHRRIPQHAAGGIQQNNPVSIFAGSQR